MPLENFKDPKERSINAYIPSAANARLIVDLCAPISVINDLVSADEKGQISVRPNVDAF